MLIEYPYKPIFLMTIRHQFKKAVFLGAGEAYLIQHNYTDLDFSKEIIHAATHNLAYDLQCEGSRAWYIYNIIQASVFRAC